MLLVSQNTGCSLLRRVLRTLSAVHPDVIKKPTGLKWEYQCAAANPAIASLLQSLRPAGRVAELGSLGRFAMTTTSNQSGLYILRLIVVILAFPTFPAFPILFIDHIPENYRWIFLPWVPFAFWLWFRLSRRMLVDSRYTCPKCNKKTARIEVVEHGDVGDVFLTCACCGFREKSDDVAWHSPSG